jgi:hypothetical protein
MRSVPCGGGHIFVGFYELPASDVQFPQRRLAGLDEMGAAAPVGGRL